MNFFYPQMTQISTDSRNRQHKPRPEVRGNRPAVHPIEKHPPVVQCMEPECVTRHPGRLELAAETPSVPLIAKAGDSYNYFWTQSGGLQAQALKQRREK
jgi:hypothetical protein